MMTMMMIYHVLKMSTISTHARFELRPPLGQ